MENIERNRYFARFVILAEAALREYPLEEWEFQRAYYGIAHGIITLSRLWGAGDSKTLEVFETWVWTEEGFFRLAQNLWQEAQEV